MRFLIGKGFSARTPYLKVWRFTLDRPPKKALCRCQIGFRLAFAQSSWSWTAPKPRVGLAVLALAARSVLRWRSSAPIEAVNCFPWSRL